MKNKRMNDKGFSLVELIVVIAIMAILAVTLAPKLTQYVEKARKASDQQVVNTIYEITKLSLADETLNSAYLSIATDTTGGYPYILNLEKQNSASTPADIFYSTSDGKTWSIATTDSGNAFIKEIQNTVGPFKLKSNLATTSSTIIISVSSSNVVTVTLDYSGTTFLSGTDYSVSD